MTTTTTPPHYRGTSTSRPSAPPGPTKGNVLVNWITTTDHKTIGYMYLITSFVYFCLGGVMALVIRAQLFEPGCRSCRPRSSTTSCSRCTARSCC